MCKVAMKTEIEAGLKQSASAASLLGLHDISDNKFNRTILGIASMNLRHLKQEKFELNSLRVQRELKRDKFS